MLNKQTYLKTARETAKDLGINIAIQDCQDSGGVLTFTIIGNFKKKDKKYLENELSSKFNQNINLKTIDYKAKAAETGGIGPCGMRLCCKRWLKKPLQIQKEELQNEQIMSTNNNLNGACGETLCCLCYAQGASTCMEDGKQKSENGNEEEKQENKRSRNQEIKRSKDQNKKQTKKIRRLKL